MSWMACCALSVLPVVMSQIKSDELIVFFPTCAHLDAGGKTWIIPIHGVVYEPEQDSLKRCLAVASIRRAVGVEGGTPAAAIFERRMRLFFVDNERGKDVSIRLGSQEYPLGKSEASGHFSAELRLSAAEVGRLLGRRQGPNDWLSFEALTPKDDARRFIGRVQLVGPSGWSVISDIDDTIKETQVGDRRAMLANTLLRDFRPVGGMAELYAQWARQGAVLHYVSGSPWQLYEPLAEFFRSAGFPDGSMHLKHFRLKDPAALNSLLSQEQTKGQAIEPILAAFPGRRFVLVGDSGEEDPEVYGKIARKYGRQIAAVLIRNVTDEAADGQRLRRALEAVERQRWELFRRPEQLQGLLGRLSRLQEAGG